VLSLMVQKYIVRGLTMGAVAARSGPNARRSGAWSRPDRGT